MISNCVPIGPKSVLSFPLLSSLPSHCECWPTMEPCTECSMINPAKHFVSCCCILTDIHRHRQTSRQTDELPNKAKNWRWLCVCHLCQSLSIAEEGQTLCGTHTTHSTPFHIAHCVWGCGVHTLLLLMMLSCFWCSCFLASFSLSLSHSA